MLLYVAAAFKVWYSDASVEMNTCTKLALSTAADEQHGEHGLHG